MISSRFVQYGEDQSEEGNRQAYYANRIGGRGIKAVTVGDDQADDDIDNKRRHVHYSAYKHDL